MEDKTREKITDVIGSIAAAPVIAGSKIVEAAQKIGSKTGKDGSVSEDLSAAANKAKQTVSDTAKKIAEGNAAKKVRDSIEQLSYTETSAKLQNAFDKTQTVVKDIADKVQDGLADGSQKAKAGLEDIKENVQERRVAAAARSAEKAAENVIDGEFFEPDSEAAAEDFFEGAEAEAAEEQPAAAAEGFFEAETQDAGPAPGGTSATLQERADAAEEKIGQFVEHSAAVIEEKAGNAGQTIEGFVEKLAGKAEDAAAGIKASAEKLEESIVKKEE